MADAVVRRPGRAAAVALAVAVLAGCTSATAPAAAGDGGVSGDLVVFAAASLQAPFAELGDLMMAEHPDLTVTVSTGGSSTLAQQLVAGAPADVFAAADTTTMRAAEAVTAEPRVFASNTLEIAVPAGNPGGVAGLDDLTDPTLVVALCAVEVPCGSAAAAVFEAAGLTPAPDTYEPSVSAVLTTVALGEADAGLVYRTDVIRAGDKVEGIEVPEAIGVVNEYPIATVLGARNPAAAEAFVALVLSPAGRRVLDDAGFGPA